MSIRIPSKLDKSITYYIAGPMSGIPDYNYPEFERVLDELSRSGISVKSPHTIPWPEGVVSEEELWRVMMKLAMNMLLECDGIILLKGWPSSTGAVLESTVARGIKYPMYFLSGNFLISMDRD